MNKNIAKSIKSVLANMALLVFCLLYIPCAAALATIRKESGSTRWMLLSALFQLAVAWIVTFVIYRIGILM